jgi:hypothetical protein
MDGWRRVHRILAVLFLLTIPPAAYFLSVANYRQAATGS